MWIRCCVISAPAKRRRATDTGNSWRRESSWAIVKNSMPQTQVEFWEVRSLLTRRFTASVKPVEQIGELTKRHSRLVKSNLSYWLRHGKRPGAGSIHITGTAFDSDTSCGDGVVVTIQQGAQVLWQQTIEN